MFVKVREPEGREEMEKLWAFRYRVYTGDARRGTYKLDHERGWLSDDMDETARHLIAVDKEDNIVGCLRTNLRNETGFPDYIADWLNLTEVNETMGDLRYGYTSLLMVEPSMRGRTVASLLALKLYHAGVHTGLCFDICCCELNLVHVYYQLGYRPYAPPFRVEGAGMRIPLILCGLDRAYMEKVGSPLVSLLPDEAGDNGSVAERLAGTFELFAEPAFEQVPERVAWAILAAGPGSESPDDRITLFKGLDGAQLGHLLGSVTRVRFARGDRIYERGETELGSGLVVSGRVGIHLVPGPDPHYVAMLGPGDVFGELSGLGAGVRTAYLTAVEPTEAMLLAPDFIDRARKKDADAAYVLSRNLNSLLAGRLSSTNDLLAAMLSGEMPEDVSYKVRETGEELRRLEDQATVMIGKELQVLRGLGLGEGQTVLDVGCGTGILTAAIAEQVADTVVTGIDNSSVALQRAQAMSSGDAGCWFVRGEAADIPVASDSHDFVFARFVVQHLKKPTEAVEEMLRVARPGGVVCLVDVDDGGIILHPEPAGYHEVQRQIEKVKAKVGGNRKMGRRLYSVLQRVEVENPRLMVLPITSAEVGAEMLLHLAFGFRKRLLLESKTWTREAARFFQDLEELPATAGHFIMVPVFVATGTKPLTIDRR